MAGGRETVVLGAGMVGVSAAIHLLKRGRRVTLIDRRGAGEETSYGNAGAVEGGSYTPIAMPRDLPTLLAYASNRKIAMHYHPAFLPRVAGWLFRLWRESSRERLVANAGKFSQVLSYAIPEHMALAREAGVDHLIDEHAGWLVVHRDPETFRDDRLDRDIAAMQGVEFRELSRDEALEYEPNLTGEIAGATFWPKVAHVRNPGALTKGYATLFKTLGGTFRAGEVVSLGREGGRWRVRLKDGEVTADDVVVALGPWTMDLLEPLGLSFPFAVKRGYHQHFRPAGNATLSRPVVDADSGFVLAPMEAGIRLTTGIEFAPRDAPKTPVQIARALPFARRLFPLADAVEPEPWMGARPSFPDSRAVIGAAPGHKGLWLDFGHAHLGLTLGPVSGRMLAAMMDGEVPEVDPAPFSPTRF
ncbi:MAG: NAD(P)/FAD-dependent oxidoreductase [Flavobacteriaceae bacterium]